METTRTKRRGYKLVRMRNLELELPLRAAGHLWLDPMPVPGYWMKRLEPVFSSTPPIGLVCAGPRLETHRFFMASLKHPELMYPYAHPILNAPRFWFHRKHGRTLKAWLEDQRPLKKWMCCPETPVVGPIVEFASPMATQEQSFAPHANTISMGPVSLHIAPHTALAQSAVGTSVVVCHPSLGRPRKRRYNAPPGVRMSLPPPSSNQTLNRHRRFLATVNSLLLLANHNQPPSHQLSHRPV